MGYRSLAECIVDLERAGQLVRIEEEIDPYLEAAEIQRRGLCRRRARDLITPACDGTAFPMVSNLFGTIDRTRFIFRDTLAAACAGWSS